MQSNRIDNYAEPKRKKNVFFFFTFCLQKQVSGLLQKYLCKCVCVCGADEQQSDLSKQCKQRPG